MSEKNEILITLKVKITGHKILKKLWKIILIIFLMLLGAGPLKKHPDLRASSDKNLNINM